MSANVCRNIAMGDRGEVRVVSAELPLFMVDDFAKGDPFLTKTIWKYIQRPRL